jgi:hypothetical protein
MIVGFSGSRNGMNQTQLDNLAMVLTTLPITEVRHGANIGADLQFHNLSILLQFKVVLHPSNNPKRQTPCPGAAYSFAPQSHYARNRHIVNASSVLISVPESTIRDIQIGGWFIVHYAEEHAKRVILLWPDGQIHDTLDQFQTPESVYEIIGRTSTIKIPPP